MDKTAFSSFTRHCWLEKLVTMLATICILTSRETWFSVWQFFGHLVAKFLCITQKW